MLKGLFDLCSLCEQPLESKAFGRWVHGNNAWPLSDQPCCDECNNTLVIPARIKGLSQQRGERV